MTLPVHAYKLPGISPRAYQHPADRAATAALGKVPYLDDVVRKLIALGYERALRAASLGAAVRLGQHQLPHIWVLHREAFNALMSRIGVTRDTTVVFYGDRNNWWACYAFWVFQLFSHTGAKIMDGGRLKWEKEGRPLTREVPHYTPTTYDAPERKDAAIRAFRDEVLAHVQARGQLVDVRSPEEYAGTRLHMPEYPNEGAMRGGHIPGAKSIPWARAVNPDDGTFKTAEELRGLYTGQNGLAADRETIAYCRIGERSSHTWFALKYLLGFEKVRNYDGSWTEWGNLVGVPIEK